MALRWQLALCFMICLSATVYVAAQDSPPLTTLTIDQPLHFLKEDGGDLLLPSGLYRLEAAQEHQLRLFPGATADPIIVEAIELPHDRELTDPVAGTLATDEDTVHVVLFLPGNTALAAVGSRSGVRTRAGALTSTQLSQVRVSPSKVNTLTDAAKTILPVERNTGAKSSGFLPSCVQSSRGVECFIQSMTAPPSLLTAAFAGGKWLPWTSLGGSITSEPSCFNPGPGFPSGMDNIACIALGLNSRLWLMKKANGQWSTNWQSIDFGDNIYAPDGVSCIHHNLSSFYSCFARQKTDNYDRDQLFEIRYSDPKRPENTGWGRWEWVGVIHSKLDCFVEHVPASGIVMEYWNRRCYGFHSGQLVRYWSIMYDIPIDSFGHIDYSRLRHLPIPLSWTKYSGQIAAPPSCVEKEYVSPIFGPSIGVICAALRSDGLLVLRGTGYPESDLWQSVAGHSLAGPPTCLTGGICFAVGQDQKLWRFDLGDNPPTRVVRIPGSARLLPRLTCVRAGPIHCFAVALTTNDLMHYQIAP